MSRLLNDQQLISQCRWVCCAWGSPMSPLHYLHSCLMPPGIAGWIYWVLLGPSLSWSGMFRIARAQATGFSSLAMASVVEGGEKCQPQVPTVSLSPLILENTFLEFSCCTMPRACTCCFATISMETCMIQTFLGIKSLLIFLMWMEMKLDPVEMRSEESGQGSRGKSSLRRGTSWAHACWVQEPAWVGRCFGNENILFWVM